MYHYKAMCFFFFYFSIEDEERLDSRIKEGGILKEEKSCTIQWYPTHQSFHWAKQQFVEQQLYERNTPESCCRLIERYWRKCNSVEWKEGLQNWASYPEIIRSCTRLTLIQQVDQRSCWSLRAHHILYKVSAMLSLYPILNDALVFAFKKM